MNIKATTIAGLQIPGFGQAHEICGGIKHVCEHSTLPLTWESGGKIQQ